MIQTLAKNWILLGVCGILEAIISSTFLSARSLNGTTVSLGELAIAAGILTITVGLWRPTSGKYRLLALNGIALGGLGVIWYALTRFRISLLTIALLVIVMALSIGILELGIARDKRGRGHIMDKWLLPAFTGAASIGFSSAFLALGLGLVKMEPGSNADLLWLGSYFAFSAVWKVSLALRLRGNREDSEFGRTEGVSPLRSTRHAH